MAAVSLSGVLLRFLLGGSAVAASAVIGRALGGRIGGVFAAFPAVYTAAVLSATLGADTGKARLAAFGVSQGALVGMSSDIICAVAAGIFITRYGWKKGLCLALVIWFVVASTIYLAARGAKLV